MSRISFKSGAVGKFAENLVEPRMRKAAGAIGALQMEMVSDAFDAQGQPSQPWPTMWADKFEGEIPSARKALVTKAALSVAKAEGEMARLNESHFSKTKQINKAQEKLDRARKALADKIERAKAAVGRSYRAGGQRLQNTGDLRKSFYIKHSFTFGKDLICVMASTLFYALFQQNGVKTKGPNFIPLTTKAVNTHSPGADPKAEGLEEGVDYFMAWGGVNVPPSPMIDYADPVNKQRINDSIQQSFFKGA